MCLVDVAFAPGFGAVLEGAPPPFGHFLAEASWERQQSGPAPHRLHVWPLSINLLCEGRRAIWVTNVPQSAVREQEKNNKKKHLQPHFV